jgi:hypothetical protein
MAQTANINIKVDSGQATQNVQGLNSAIDGTSKSTQSLKAELRQITQELQGLEPGSARFNELSTRAGKLKDTISDTNASVNALAGNAVENLGGALQGVAQIGTSAFQGIVSAQALLGVKSEALQETMVKLQAAMGLAQAVKDLGGFSDTITNLKAGFTNFTKSAVSGLQGVKGAVAATGIGLLVIAVGLLVAYWDDIKAAVSGVSKEQEELNKKTEANLEVAQKKVKELKSQDNILRLQGKTEKEILQLKVIAVGTTIKEAKARLGAQEATLKAQVETEKRNYEITKGIIMFSTIGIQMLLGAVDKVSEGLKALGIIDKALTLRDDFASWAASFVFDPEETKTKGLEAINETKELIRTLENEQAGYQLEIKRIETQAVEERRQLGEKGAQDEKKKNKAALDEKRKLEDSRIALMADGLEKDLELNRVAFERKIEDEIDGEKNLSAQKKEIVSNYGKEKEQIDAEIRKKYTDEEIKALEEKKAREQKEREEKKAAEKKLIADMKAADEQAYQDEKKLEEIRISNMKEGFDKQKALEKLAYNDRLHLLQNLLDEEKISTEEFQKLQVEEYYKYQAKLADIDKAANEKAIADNKAKYDKISEQIDKWGGATMELAGSLNDLFDAIGANRERKITESFKVESEALKSQLDNRLISQAEYDAQVKQMEQKKEEELKKIKQKQFRRNKAQNIAEAIMAGALAVLNALGSSLPPANFILAGIVGASSAVQIGTIASQNFTAARGGIVPGDGPGNIDSVPSMLAPGEAVINARSTSMFPRTLDMINQAGGGQALLPSFAQDPVVPNKNVFSDNQQQPIKAYVVETEITNKQKRVNRIQTSAEF